MRVLQAVVVVPVAVAVAWWIATVWTRRLLRAEFRRTP